MSTVFGAGAVICTTLMEIVDDRTQIVLTIVTILLVLAGLAALVRARTYARLSAAAWRWVRRRGVPVAVVAVLLVVGTTAAGLALQSARSCQDAVETAVMVPEDGAAGFAAAAAAFERDSVNAFSCPQYHVTTFGVGWPALREAFASGWADAPGGGGTALLNIGPRPDVWIAESVAQAAIVDKEGADQGFSFVDSTLVAGSPLVLAVPEPHAEVLRATAGPDDTLEDLIDGAEAAGLDVVRANPDTSFASMLHTVRLYADPETDTEALELGLGHALEQAGLPVGTDSALLCRLRELSRTEAPRVAVLTTERALVDGGASCPASGQGDGDGALSPFYPGAALGLDYTAVELSWAADADGDTDAGGAGRRADAAAAFVDWLGTTEGETALGREVGVRGLAGRPLSGAEGLSAGPQQAPEVKPGTSVVADTRVLSTEKQYRTARRPARVLVLVDSSASMARPADGDRRRIDVAERGVLGALEHLGGSDEVGVWSFSGAVGSSPRELLGLTGIRAAGSEAPERLGELAPGGRTPLYDAVDAGTSYLVGLDADGATRKHLTALVVLTDGENTPGEDPGAALTASDLVRAARAEAAAGVRVYVVAVGEASCQVSDLQQIAAEWDGECWDSSFGELETTLSSLFGQLGGR